MKKVLAVLVLGFISWTCSNDCASGAVCGDNNFIGASSVPSPSPAPVVTVTPDPCRVESIQVGFFGGAQVPYIGINVPTQVDATPFNSSGEVPKGCNLTRTPAWQVNTPATCQILGSGYNPYLRGLKVGGCSVTATMVNVSGSMNVEVQ